jgi:hypothetical protein
MDNIETDGRTQAENQDIARPYAPSWIHFLGGWVDRRPGPNWSYYLGLAAIMLLIQAIVLWADGAPTTGIVWLALAYLAAAIAYMLALIHYLDKRAVEALATMRPALNASKQEYRQMCYRLSTLPALTTLLASLAALAFVILTEAIGEPLRPEALAAFSVSTTLFRISYLMCWFVFGAFLYHTVHQLRVINHIYTQHTRIDLFRAKPLYAFSNLAALTAGSLAMISYGWLLANPWIDQTDPFVLIPMFFLSLFAIITFIWPQMGIHRIQVSEKERLLDEASQRFEAAIGKLHRRMDDGELEEMTELNMAMASLEIELNALRKTPTWPWEPEVLQLLITALAFPLGLWLIQLILQRTLGQ